MDLITSLHAAAGDPPPTSIDLDVLIRAEERRGYRQRRLFGAGAVSGVAVLVGAASLGWPLGARAPVGDGGAPVCPWVSPSGDPSLRPPAASTSLIPPPMSPSMSPSMSLSPPMSEMSPSGTSPSVSESDPNVEASGSPAMPPPATLPSASATWLGPVPSGLVGRMSPFPDRSPSEVCADTLRRLERVLSDALARIAPDAHPTAPIRFFAYSDGTVRAVVFFADGSHLEVVLYLQWAGSAVAFRMSEGGAYHSGSSNHGLLLAVTTDGPLTSTQMEVLVNEPGLTLTG